MTRITWCINRVRFMSLMKMATLVRIHLNLKYNLYVPDAIYANGGQH